MTLLSVDQAAARLSTKPRFIRRLIAERRIPYVKLGAHVRIEDSALDAFIDAGRIGPRTDAGLSTTWIPTDECATTDAEGGTY